MAKNYNTAGKTRLVDFLKDHAEAQLTVEDICLSLNGNLSKRSSVYRNLSSLCDEGSVKKFHADSGYVYQFVRGRECSNHFHLKCLKCEKILHLECEKGSELTNHIMSHHGFSVDSGRSILYGVCDACAEK